MHTSAYQNFQHFQKYYLSKFSNNPYTLIDVGAQDVNGSIKNLMTENVNYIGIDFTQGKNVDVVLTDPYSFPLDSNIADIATCTSVFEHAALFWLTFLEIIRILKPGGLFYLNVPANGMVHKFPMDCWRFYPDAGLALEMWAKRNNYDVVLLESYVHGKLYDVEDGRWHDNVMIFIKDSTFIDKFPDRIIQNITGFVDEYCFTEQKLYSYKDIVDPIQ